MDFAATASPIGLDCVFLPAKGGFAPAVAAATIQVSRPNWRSDLEPPQRFIALRADVSCTGTTGSNQALPSGAFCTTADGSLATTRVSALTAQSGIRVTVSWNDPDADRQQLTSAALHKANSLAQAVLATL